MSGSAGGGGYEFQARVAAYLSVKVLQGVPLRWVSGNSPDIPIRIAAETESAGDDIQISLSSGAILEVQVKRGLNADGRLMDAVIKLLSGLVQNDDSSAIIVVDPTSSRSVREEFREGLNRIRKTREDYQHNVTGRVISHLENIGKHELVSELNRLYVIELALESRQESNYENALSALAGLLVQPNLAEAAWNTLCMDALSDIRQRGGADAYWISDLLSRSSMLLARNTAPARVVSYCRWVAESTANLRNVGVPEDLPVTTVPARTQVIANSVGQRSIETVEDFVKRYRDWERLASSGDTYDAGQVAEYGHRTVVLGGPGSGKSTLCQQTAYRLASEGQVVLRVSLPKVALRIRNGDTIDEAIIAISTDGFAHPGAPEMATLRQALDRPDCLLADGLDECGIDGQRVALDLAKWASARRKSRVIIASRPLGHDPAWFPKWQYVELQPLSDLERDRFIDKLTRILQPDSPVDAIERIRQQIAASSALTIASKLPILLALMTVLASKGKSLARNRSGLYEQIVKEWSVLSGHEGLDAPIEAPTMLRGLEFIGWLLDDENNPNAIVSRVAVEDGLGRHLTQELALTSLAGENLAHQILLYWERVGILVSFEAGRDSYVVFAYKSLGEFMAAKYSIRLSDSEFSGWVNRALGQKSSQEVLRFAASITGDERALIQLLDLARKSPRNSTALRVALSAIADMESLDSDTTKSICALAISHLSSPSPSIAYAMTETLVPVVSAHGLPSKEAIRELLGHDQIHTRLCASRILLAGDTAIVSTRELVTILGEGLGYFSRRPKKFFLDSVPDGWRTWSSFVSQSAQVLLRRPSEDAAVDVVEQIAESGTVPIGVHSQLLSYLHLRGRPRLMLQKLERSSGNPQAEPRNWDDFQREDLEHLDTLAKAIGVENRSPSGQPSKLLALGTLLEALEYQSMPANDWRNFISGGDIRIASAILGMVIRCLRLTPDEVARDISWARHRVLAGLPIADSDDRYVSLYNLIPWLPIEVDWSHAPFEQSDVGELLAGLSHRCKMIANAAAKLLASIEDVNAKRLAESEFRLAGEQATFLLSQLSEWIWGPNAVSGLISVLERPARRSDRWIFDRLTKLPGGLEVAEVIPIVFDRLEQADSELAASAANYIANRNPRDFAEHTTSLRAVYDKWRSQGEYCTKDRVFFRTGSCPVCRSVRPTPRTGLVHVLVSTGEWGLEDLLSATEDPNGSVASIARECLEKFLQVNRTSVPRVLEAVRSGRRVRQLLQSVMALPESLLLEYRDDLMNLYLDLDVSSKIVMIRASRHWLDQYACDQFLAGLLGDSSDIIREAAFEAIHENEWEYDDWVDE